ncbi:MAG: glycosyltransferase family 39 protein [Flavobacteriia bacterium]|nr:glycosyltransferase family 39 protein [Flavobacteriia bacterium]
MFLFLGKLPFQRWDEGRVAINTYEMMERGNILSLTFGGHPEFWNTKPTLLHWLQSASALLFGFSEFSLRLPSALAGLLACFAVYSFVKSELKKEWTAVLAAFVLVSFSGFIGTHSARTCEYDALLALFTTLAAFSFYRAVEYSTKSLYTFFFFLALAALTKGIAALMFGPIYLIWALWKRRVMVIIKSKSFYLGLLGFLAIVAVYYLGREHVQPGYLEAVYQNELGGRFGETMEEHSGSFFFYFVTLKNSIPLTSLLLLLVGIPLGLKSEDENTVKTTSYATLFFFAFTFILGAAGTKLDWYYTPVFPFVAILIAIGLKEMYNRVIVRPNLTGNKAIIIQAILLIGFIAIPFGISIDRSINPEFSHREDRIAGYLSEVLHDESATVDFDVLWDGYDAQHRIYVILLQDQGHTIRFASKESLALGKKYLVSQSHLHDFISENYTFQREEINEVVSFYKLQSHVE